MEVTDSIDHALTNVYYDIHRTVTWGESFRQFRQNRQPFKCQHKVVNLS